jgi:hypothetical protein
VHSKTGLSNKSTEPWVNLSITIPSTGPVRRDKLTEFVLEATMQERKSSMSMLSNSQKKDCLEFIFDNFAFVFPIQKCWRTGGTNLKT